MSEYRHPERSEGSHEILRRFTLLRMTMACNSFQECGEFSLLEWWRTLTINN
ncbi:MAG: hypothetical protein US75_C0002G0036 [Candidatus Woesebacteria bacterium GW2011_GWC1_38_13]|uniref:Uncharacterized protein n=3 Tax=Candidatus Woeseibacteriota TaxID=1752722 RepID=A0A0G0KWV4_9BACT|nr:MAG: hypothetical protein US75_C0002G0036 [Candidatus Woesebacteria bacterium GW2011_GWC1_38_13]KKQ84148.1 MAG: hypothetical protein UT06_C0009G0005 [Candidatus Woesebacteria bacterium GW2011_GWA1_38_8]